jgi:hypothetical protein
MALLASDCLSMLSIASDGSSVLADCFVPIGIDQLDGGANVSFSTTRNDVEAMSAVVSNSLFVASFVLRLTSTIFVVNGVAVHCRSLLSFVFVVFDYTVSLHFSMLKV